jgi:hypothetical protein
LVQMSMKHYEKSLWLKIFHRNVMT